MEFLLIIVSVVFFCLNGSMTRLFQLKIGKNHQSIRLYQAGYCLIASVARIVTAPPVPVDIVSFLYALLFGICFFTCAICSSECIDCGPMSLTSLIANLSLLIPLLWSCIFNGESITLIQYAGIAFLIAAFTVSAFSSSEKDTDKKSGRKSVSFKWLILVAVVFIFNGLTAVLQKLDKLHDPASDVTFIAVAYFVCSMLFLVSFFVENKGQKVVFSEYYSGPVILIAVIILSGVGTQIGNTILGSLCDKVPAPILYPSINGGLAVLTSIVSFIAFREKLNAKKIIALVLGCISIVLLNL